MHRCTFYWIPCITTADLGCHVTKTALCISLCHIKQHLRVYYYLSFHSSLITRGIIHQIVFGYFDLYVLLFITIKYDMKTAQKIVRYSIKENRLPSKVSSLR